MAGGACRSIRYAYEDARVLVAKQSGTLLDERHSFDLDAAAVTGDALPKVDRRMNAPNSILKPSDPH
jgi:hypothetical protein